MDNSTITPERIPVSQFLLWKDHPVKPIDGINIPNISIPPHLVSKKRATEANDTLPIRVRQLFNSLTADNIQQVKEQLRADVYAKAQNVEMLIEIADEILKNFVVSEQNIKNYMHLLNAIWNASVLIPGSTEKVVSRPIGFYFMRKCKDMIDDCISEANIKSLAEMDVDDSDEFDIYNRKRQTIINLIVTICCLYEQRNTTLIKLTAVQIYVVIKSMLDIYKKFQARMTELGNPYEEDCSDEDEYELLRKMCTLYAEQLYTFMIKEGPDFVKDTTPVFDQEINKDQILKHLVDRFKTEVMPTLTESYMIAKCESLEL